MQMMSDWRWRKEYTYTGARSIDHKSIDQREREKEKEKEKKGKERKKI